MNTIESIAIPIPILSAYIVDVVEINFETE